METRTRCVLQGEVDRDREGPTSPSPACRVGVGCLQAGGWGAVVGTFPKSFPVALGLATSVPHPPPLRLPTPHAAPQGAGVPECHVSGEEQGSQAGTGGGGPRAAAASAREPEPGPSLGRGKVRSGRAGQGCGENPLAQPDPGPSCPAGRPGAETAGGPCSAGPVPGQRSRSRPPTPPGEPPTKRSAPQSLDPRGGHPGPPKAQPRGARSRLQVEARPEG